jgi:hypothetical protein
MLIRILFVAPSCLDEAHEVVREIAAAAMEELKKQKAKSIAKPH